MSTVGATRYFANSEDDLTAADKRDLTFLDSKDKLAKMRDMTAADLLAKYTQWEDRSGCLGDGWDLSDATLSSALFFLGQVQLRAPTPSEGDGRTFQRGAKVRRTEFCGAFYARDMMSRE